MALSDFINTFGQDLLKRYGERVHKLAINAGLTCPNRDGSKGRGGCTFCNNASFNPMSRRPPTIAEQIESGRRVIRKRTGAKRYMSYEYISIAADMIERTPPEVRYHRVTGTAEEAILLAPDWCAQKWAILNGIEIELARRGSCQGSSLLQALEIHSGTDG